MDTVALAAQLVLAAVFAVAAVGKLVDLSGSRRALAAFGLSGRLASVGGTLLPIIELAIAVLLVLRSTAQWASVAALVLLIGFIGAIARAMSRGETPDCNCFGALHSAPAGGRALVRNAALALVAAFVALRGPGPSLPNWVGDRTGAELVAGTAGIAVIALGAMLGWVWWQNRRLRQELAGAQETIGAIPPGLPVGALAPAFEVPVADGTTLTLGSLRGGGRFVALVFVRPGCGPSEALLSELERWRGALSDRLTIAVVGTGSIARYRRNPHWPDLASAVAHDPALLEENDALYELFDAYRLIATPSAVILTPQGTIASATVDGAPAIEALLRLTLSRWTGGAPARVDAIGRSAAA